ncbi:MAG: dUTP diphosphatase [Proteobacteria bacterium]|nr:dUTP diphosphatase [Pseudomonadota bacterium]
MISVDIIKLPHGKNLPLPAYATSRSAGMDLIAAIEKPILLNPLERQLIPTGISLAVPEGFEGQIRPRSGLAFKHGITVLNSPGTIDADYRGEIKVLLINLGNESFTLERGLRIAQFILAPVSMLSWREVDQHIELIHNDREGGFGSTGLKHYI